MPNPIFVTAAVVAAMLVAPGAIGQSKGAPTAPDALPRAKFITDMDAEFRKMDADKNGQVTKAEVEQHQKSQAAAQAKARNKALFAQLDKDKNGLLSQAEFEAIATPAPTANGQAMLARMDSNRDNQISLVEHRTATLANFDRLDADKDGVVTATEMKAGGIAPR